jgi:hypothetical protein
MTNITPMHSQETAEGALRNALTIAQMGRDGYLDDDGQGYRDIARLLKHTLEQLGEPSLAAVQATEILVREWHGTPDGQRSARDTAAGILHAQMTGAVPPTWKVP